MAATPRRLHAALHWPGNQQENTLDCCKLPGCSGKHLFKHNACFGHTTKTEKKPTINHQHKGGQATHASRAADLHPTVSYTVAGTQALRPQLLPAGKQALNHDRLRQRVMLASAA